MRALLMHRDRDFDLQQGLPRHDRSLTRDLELDTLLCAMAADDAYLFEVARKALLLGPGNEVHTILYRQEILGDCLKNPALVRELYQIAVESIESRRKHYVWGFSTRYPGGILRGSIEVLQTFVGTLRKLKSFADEHAGKFKSAGFTALLEMLRNEFSDPYFVRIQNHLEELKFNAGVLISAQPGNGNEGTHFVLREERDKRPKWLKRILGQAPPAYTFRIADRDEAGARALSELRDRGINLVANALAQSTDHILSFFDILCAELAFYVACLNLHDRLTSMAAPTCFPVPAAATVRNQRFRGLYDVCLALTMGRAVVGNDLDADGKSLVIITGANQGGKSTFLRGIGLAQMMMQAGMFVAAESFTAGLCSGLFTHYKREEDATMEHGKLDEELARMSEIVDDITPNALLLFNESFASTNELEGSEIARQVVRALLEKRIRVFFVTHLYEFAHGLLERSLEDGVFLRAGREEDGTRSYRLVEGEPLETSYGEDLYKEIFAADTEELSVC